MLRIIAVPTVLILAPLVRLCAKLLAILLTLAALGAVFLASHTGAAADWLYVGGLLLAVGALRWLRAATYRAENAVL
jgi:hypothetical protein